jgi:hypothetical protein
MSTTHNATLRTQRKVKLLTMKLNQYSANQHPVLNATLTVLAAALFLPYGAATAQATDSNLTDKAAMQNVATPASESLFRAVQPVGLSSINSHLTVSADEGLWKQSKGMPLGSKLLMSVTTVNVPADGKSYTRIKISAFDAEGKPMLTLKDVNNAPIKLLLETNLGRFQVAGLASSKDADGFNRGNPTAGNPLTSPMGQPTTELRALEVLLLNGEAQVTLMSPATPGTAQVRASSGAVGVQGEINFSPDLRPLMVVGIIEGALNASKINKDVNAPEITNTSFEESLRNWSNTTGAGTNSERTLAGRVAFFAKGTVKGEYLLTAALDSDKLTKEQLFRDIDPNAFYPIYGDASVKQFDAQSKSRLFVRVDHNKSYALFGDYTTATETGNSLASYNRSLTGAKWHFETASVKVNAYAAKDTLRSYIDEQAGAGISGPYAVGKPNAVANSEQITIVVRDRLLPAVVLKSTPMTRFVDYDFEPFSGRILFRQPIPRADENLNPVSIRVSYELEEGGEKFWVGGIDAKIKLGENVSVGASHAEDKNATAPYKLSGVNAQIKLGDKTFVTAEFAKSTGTQFYNASISSATLGTSPALGMRISGNAVKVEARHEGEVITARAAYAKSDANFQNSNAGLLAARQEISVRADVRATETITVYGEASQSKDNSGSASATNGSKRGNVSLGGNIVINDALNLDLSLNRSKQHVVGGSAGLIQPVAPSSSTGNGFGFNGTGLLGGATVTGLSPTVASNVLADDSYTSVKGRVTVKVSENASLYGEYERASQHRSRTALGGEYRITEKTRLYAKHEFANSLASGYGLGSGVKVSSTVVGLDTAYMQDGQIFSEYRLAGAQGGQDSAASLGLRNLWKLSEGLAATTSIERQRVQDAAGVAHNATALALGAEYTASPLYKLGGKLELRRSESQDQLLSTIAFNRKLSDNWAALARNLYMRTKGHGSGLVNGTQTQDRVQVGLAYRGSETNKFHGLSKLEHRVDKNTAAASVQDSKTTIASLHGNYHPSRPWTYAGQLAFKSVNETFGTNGAVSKWNGNLIALRGIWDFAERFDASLYASLQKGGASQFTGIGGELGYRVVDNLWLSTGYTRGKFSDTELFSSNTSRSGWHLRLRYSFDEKIFSGNDPRVNRMLDGAADGADKAPRQWRE